MEIEVSEKEKRRSDPYIWGIIIILYIVSVVEVYSAISREITGGDVYSPIIKHIMLLFSGFVITYVTSQIHYKWFKVLAYLMIPLTITLSPSFLSCTVTSCVSGCAFASVIKSFACMTAKAKTTYTNKIPNNL